MPGRFAGLARKGRLLAPFVFLAGVLFASNAPAACRPSGPLEQATVAWHYDGDTLRLTDDRRVRLLGIDTPGDELPQGHAAAAGAARPAAPQTLLPKGGPVRLARDRQRAGPLRPRSWRMPTARTAAASRKPCCAKDWR